MKKDVFLKDYVRGRKASQSCIDVVKLPKVNHSYHLHSLTKEFHSVKGLIKHIDFHCEINPAGGCKYTPESRMCCCYNCVDNVGYIHLMFEKDMPYYARHFNATTGFWRKGKGCILPHHKRSITCLTHNCNHEDEGYKHFSKGIYEVGRLMKKTRNEIIDVCAKI